VLILVRNVTELEIDLFHHSAHNFWRTGAGHTLGRTTDTFQISTTGNVDSSTQYTPTAGVCQVLRLPGRLICASRMLVTVDMQLPNSAGSKEESRTSVDWVYT
jgi:hypothetical protein